MIAVVWILSAVICFPPLAGWTRPQPVRDDGLDQCVLSREPAAKRASAMMSENSDYTSDDVSYPLP